MKFLAFLVENRQVAIAFGGIAAALIAALVTLVVALWIYPRQRRIDQQFKIAEERRQADARLAEEKRQFDAKIEEEKRQEYARAANNSYAVMADFFSSANILARELRVVKSLREFEACRDHIRAFEEACARMAATGSDGVLVAASRYAQLVRELLWHVRDIQDDSKASSRPWHFARRQEIYDGLPAALSGALLAIRAERAIPGSGLEQERLAEVIESFFDLKGVAGSEAEPAHR